MIKVKLNKFVIDQSKDMVARAIKDGFETKMIGWVHYCKDELLDALYSENTVRYVKATKGKFPRIQTDARRSDEPVWVWMVSDEYRHKVKPDYRYGVRFQSSNYEYQYNVYFDEDLRLVETTFKHEYDEPDPEERHWNQMASHNERFSYG